MDIASFTRIPSWPQGATGRAFRDYRQALAESEAEIAYVSTRNHDHAVWANAALATGRHVIVDKPAGLSPAEVEKMASHAARAGRLLAEATTWSWHPQFRQLRALLEEASPGTRILSTFSFPPLPPDDVRYRRDWGGGALWDLGPYAVSSGRLLFGAAPDDIAACAINEPGKEVETAFGVLMRYPGDRLLAGHFGFTTAYVNRLEVIGPRLALTLERAFTTAPDQPCRISGQHLGQPVAVEVPACDAFARFLTDVFEGIRTGNHDPYAEAMIADSRALARLRLAAGMPVS